MPVPPWKMSFCCLRFSFGVGGERRGSRGCTNHNLHIWICLFIHLRGRTMVEQVPPHWPWRHNLQGEGIDGKYEDKDKDDLPGILRSQLGGGEVFFVVYLSLLPLLVKIRSTQGANEWYEYGKGSYPSPTINLVRGRKQTISSSLSLPLLWLLQM